MWVLLQYNFKIEFHTKQLVPRGEGSGKNYTLKLSTKYKVLSTNGKNQLEIGHQARKVCP